MSAIAEPDHRTTLIVGPETFLAERAVAETVATLRAALDDVDVSDTAGKDLTGALLAEATSPSLFSTRQILVIRGIHDVSDDVGKLLVDAATDRSDDVYFVATHPGGVKGKKLLAALRKAGVRELAADKMSRPDDQVMFVRTEARRSGAKIDEPTARQLVEALGGDVRTLASAVAQLSTDAPDRIITSSVVSMYFEGRAEVKGWAVADRAVAGRTPEAIEQLRWALQTGTEPVLIIGSLAAALRSLAQLSGVPRGVRDADTARTIGVPPWKIRILRSQLRGWSSDGLAKAIQAVANADLEVKGESNDPTLALTSALMNIGAARASG